MNYRGVSIRITLASTDLSGEAAADALARIGDALADAPPERKPNAVSSGGACGLIVRYRTRVTPQEAYRASVEATQRAGFRAKVSIWVGPPGTSVFGDTPEATKKILARIAAGIKTTCISSFADCISDGEALPAKGDIVTALDHAGVPALRYRILDCLVLPFEDVPRQFEGLTEPDRIAVWWQDNQPYLQRIGMFDPQMLIVCERFRVTEILLPALQHKDPQCSKKS